ncbi:serine/threonine-protein kinase [Limnoglobus roseus]|uniref:Tetratricopeptide repeat protein n=1 Tax=Limnoglobus roseus TaxID=2598579 RepID=A0A5C1AHM4_9BACT|nr:serine/threonine-protein kinase [Limnoglobus roseus]QEL18939.1 tetratricopeptide repeat protein [Limnoglobus roseus]
MEEINRTQIQSPPDSDSTVAQTSDQIRHATELPKAAFWERSEGDYELREEIARGGMGVVHRAYDRRFGREVAIKSVHTHLQHDRQVVQRFLSEAKITARLEHPGVPPIHDLGTLPDGRPFLAMKLIHGRTLTDILAERSDQDLGSLLGTFEKICQAVAFAHRRGIIHRDLKPANVMVGEFGEVQVMDWGIAKDRKGEADDRTELTTAREIAATETQTQDGTVIGTPAFIPPEQARGETDAVTERSDVFGLGAILCVILTGQPPFVGTGAFNTVKLAAAGNLSDAFTRLDRCDADPELISLAKLCLTAKPEDRLADGEEVAHAIAGYRAGVEEKLRAVEVEKAQAAVKAAELRKRRRIAYALALSVLAFLGLSAGGAWWANRQATIREAEQIVREGATRGAIESALSQADAAIRAGKVDDADLVLSQIEPRLAELSENTFPLQFADLRLDIRTVRELDAAADLRWSLQHNRTGYDEERKLYQIAFERAGFILGGPPESLADRIRSSRIRDRLVAGLDEWLEIGPDQTGLPELLALADPDPFRTQVRAALARKDLKTVRTLVAGVNGETLPPAFAAIVGSRTVLPADDAERLLRPAYAAHRDSFPLAISLGAASVQPRSGTSSEGAVGYFRAAVALRPKNLRARLMLILALSTRGQHEEAVREGKAAVELVPDSLRALNALAAAHYQAGQLSEAEASYQTALEKSPSGPAANQKVPEFRMHAVKTLSKNPTGRPASDAYLGLGGIRFDLADYAGAARAYQKAREISPDDTSAITYEGDALDASGQLDAALTLFRTAAAQAPPESSYQQYRLVVALRDRRLFTEAAEQSKKLWDLPIFVAEEVFPLAVDIALENHQFQQAHEQAQKQLGLVPPTSVARKKAEALNEWTQNLLSLSQLPPTEREKILQNQSTDNIMSIYRLAEFYRYSGARAEAARAYRILTGITSRVGVQLPSKVLISAARTTLSKSSPPTAVDRKRALEFLWAAAESLGEAHSQAETVESRLSTRKGAYFLRSDGDFSCVRNAQFLGQLPPTEQQSWQRLWAKFESIAARSDRAVREAPPAPRER